MAILTSYGGGVATTTNVISKSGVQDISNAATSVSVVFNAAYPSGTSYQILGLTIVNTTDGSAANILPGVVTALGLTGFTVQLTAATDSANYDLHWSTKLVG